MSAPQFKVGDLVQIVEWTGRVAGGVRRIVGETRTMWIDEYGKRFRKSDGLQVPKYLDTRRRIAPVEGGAS